MDLKLLKELIENVEKMPFEALYSPVTHHDFLILLKILDRYLSEKV